MNLDRYQYSVEERAFIAARLATLGQGRPEKTGMRAGLSQGEAAERLDVSERSLQHAKRIEDKGIPELQRAVEKGEVDEVLQKAKAEEAEKAKEEVSARRGQKLPPPWGRRRGEPGLCRSARARGRPVAPGGGRQGPRTGGRPQRRPACYTNGNP